MHKMDFITSHTCVELIYLYCNTMKNNKRTTTATNKKKPEDNCESDKQTQRKIEEYILQ